MLLLFLSTCLSFKNIKLKLNVKLKDQAEWIKDLITNSSSNKIFLLFAGNLSISEVFGNLSNVSRFVPESFAQPLWKYLIFGNFEGYFDGVTQRCYNYTNCYDYAINQNCYNYTSYCDYYSNKTRNWEVINTFNSTGLLNGKISKVFDYPFRNKLSTKEYNFFKKIDDNWYIFEDIDKILGIST
jgi:hypothetical protein